MDRSLRKHVALVGENGCGKRSLIWRISEHTFLGDESLPTSLREDVEIAVNDTTIQMYLWHIYTEDPYGYRPLGKPQLEKYQSDVVLMCFSIGDTQQSLEEAVEWWMPEVRHFRPDVPVILVGTKKELRDELLLSGWYEYEEPVTPEQGRAMATRIGAHAYLECSAKTNEGVREVFETAAKTLLQKRTKKNLHCSIM